MVRLEYFNGKEWVLVEGWHNAGAACATLGGDTFNYRVVDENGKVLKEDTTKVQLSYPTQIPNDFEWLDESPKEDQQPSKPLKSKEEIYNNYTKDFAFIYPKHLKDAALLAMEEYAAQFKDQQPSGDVDVADKIIP